MTGLPPNNSPPGPGSGPIAGQASGQASGAKRSDPLPDNAPHVLVVDDDLQIRDLLGRYLVGNGFRVTTAADAANARAAMRGLAFDLVILDVMMPGEDGLTLARSLKADLEHPDLHVDGPGRRPATASPASRSASTITSPNRSSRASCCCDCRTSCAVAAKARALRDEVQAWATSHSRSDAAS